MDTSAKINQFLKRYATHAGDERLSPIPKGENYVVDQVEEDPLPERMPFIRGPFVVSAVSANPRNDICYATCVRVDEGSGDLFVEGLRAGDERPFRVYPGKVTDRNDDGSFVVENNREWSFRPGTMLMFRPLAAEDYTWMGVKEQKTVTDLAKLAIGLF